MEDSHLELFLLASTFALENGYGCELGISPAGALSCAARYPEVGAIVSNELLDAFAPVKLRYNVYQNDTRACTSWQEVPSSG